MNLQDFRLIAAPFTPFDASGDLNVSLIPAYAIHLAASGVRGVFIAGTTGEGQSLSVEERIALADAWVKCSGENDLELIVHVGHNCQHDAIRLATHASSISADAIAMHGPTWFKQVSLDDLIAFCAPVAAVAGTLPFYLYDFPGLTGINVSSAKFLNEAKATIPNLAGIKYTNPDCVTAQECIQADGGAYDILWGTDQALLAGIALGATGAVGSTYNFAAPIYRRIIEAVEAGDWQAARQEQARAVALVRLMEQFPTLAAQKSTMKLVGLDFGPVRPPLANLSAADEERLCAELDRLNFAADFAPRQQPSKRTTSRAAEPV
jgi:N-acetylneuraminate lyase